jgi:hypothetical protein
MEQSASFSGSTDGWLFKIDGDGKIIWQKRVGAGSFDELSSAQLTSDGGFVVAGETKSFGISAEDFWVLKFDSGGNILWQKRYGGSSVEEAESIALTPDGGFIVVGITKTFGAGLRDIWAIKLDSSGGLSGCSEGVAVKSTTADTFTTTSDNKVAGLDETVSSAKVKETSSIVMDSDANISTQCSSG